MRAERLAAARLALAVALAALAHGAALAAEFGTLLHTPEERERLERLRRGEPTERHAAAPPPRPNEVTGYVKRSDGRSTVWIDGVALPVDSAKAAPLLKPEQVREPGGAAGTIRIERRPTR